MTTTNVKPAGIRSALGRATIAVGWGSTAFLILGGAYQIVWFVNSLVASGGPPEAGTSILVWTAVYLVIWVFVPIWAATVLADLVSARRRWVIALIVAVIGVGGLLALVLGGQTIPSFWWVAMAITVLGHMVGYQSAIEDPSMARSRLNKVFLYAALPSLIVIAITIALAGQ